MTSKPPIKLSADEVEKPLMEFIESLEGELPANELAKAYNRLARRHAWLDRLCSR